MREWFHVAFGFKGHLRPRDWPSGMADFDEIPPPPDFLEDTPSMPGSTSAVTSQPTPAPAPLPRYVDAVLFFCIVFVFICTAVDWGLSKDRKRRIKERMGDYWTALQYKSISAILLQTLRTATVVLRKNLRITPKSWRTFVLTIPITVVLMYVFWWTVVSVGLYSFGYRTGTPWNPALKVWPIFNAPLWIVVALWLYAFAAITWKGFFVTTVDYPTHWKGWARPLVVLLTCLSLLLPAGVVYWILFDMNDIHRHIAAIPSAIQMARGEPTNLPFNVPD